MVMNKVMESRYKKIKFPIISIGELEKIIKDENNWFMLFINEKSEKFKWKLNFIVFFDM